MKASTIINKRRKLLKERNSLLLKRLSINKTLRQLYKELDGIDMLIVNGD